MAERIHYLFSILPSNAGQRIDQVICDTIGLYSRSQIQKWISVGEVKLNGAKIKKSRPVLGGEKVQFSPLIHSDSLEKPEPIQIEIIYEDQDLLVLNKRAGMVVHRGAGAYSGTLVSALLHHYPPLQELPRAGLLHRLDKDTTGLLIVAKNQASLQNLTKQLRAREIKRYYLAICDGHPPKQGSIDAPIGRSQYQRTRMIVRKDGKESKTWFKVRHYFLNSTFLQIELETGRTHQIRVHFEYLGHHIYGDQIYRRKRTPKDQEKNCPAAPFSRQALHAYKIVFFHPSIQRKITLHKAPPADFLRLLLALYRSK